MRWRTQDEVINGKGEQECASKHCNTYKELSTYEVNFKYVEEGQQKQALVKVKCCEDCAKKLNYKVNNFSVIINLRNLTNEQKMVKFTQKRTLKNYLKYLSKNKARNQIMIKNKLRKKLSINEKKK